MTPKNLRISLSLLLGCITLATTLKAQITEGEFLESAGPIPADFLESWSNKYQNSLNEGLRRNKDEDDLKDFWLPMHHGIDELLQSGYYSFGDPISIYINEIADHLLRHDEGLRDQIQIYTFRSPSVNAFTLANGIIALNTGLLAHVNSEAELAFVIAHEISHYTKEHLYESYQAYREATENSFGKPSLSGLSQIENIIERKKEHEIEADLNGLELYLKSDYALEAVNDLLSTLHRSYIPYGRAQVSSNPFCVVDDCFEIPNFYYREKISPISLSEDYEDQRLTHPNIGTRRNAIQAALVQREIKPGALFVISESRFKKLRELARFEVVREQLKNGGFASALYDIYVLEGEYPNNKFLTISKVQALYGLASFKVVDEISSVLPSSSKVEGPSQQLVHLIKQMNRSQLVIIALQASLAAEKKFPKEIYLNRYSSELAKYLLVYCDEEPKNFQQGTEQIPAFSKSASEFKSQRAYYRAQQKHYRNFHRYLISDQINQAWLEQEMIKYKSYHERILAYRQLSVEEREERKKAKWKRVENEGSGFNIRELIVLDPVIMVLNIGEDFDERLEGLEQEREYKQNLEVWIKEQGIKPELLYSEHMKATDIESYNQFCKLQEWVNEARAFQQFNLMPISIDIRDEVPNSNRYVCRIIGIIDKNGRDLYYFGLFDLKKGKVIYQREETVGRKLSMQDLEEQTKKDLFIIYN